MHNTRIFFIGILPARYAVAVGLGVALVACTAKPTNVVDDFAFDGTCVNCHAGLSAGHVHGNYKLRCIDCHGGNDQVDVPPNTFADTTQPLPRYRDPTLLAQAHVKPKPGLARFFFANGIDDNGDGRIDETVTFDNAANPTKIMDFGEVFEPQLHGEGAGEFIDTELSRDLNYTRFLNPGDLRVATIGCGSKNRAGIEGGFGCHQQTVDIVRRNIMVNQSAVTNGAYYGNESWRDAFSMARDELGKAADPRFGAFSYSLDYDGADACITVPAPDPAGRAQPTFDSACLEKQAAMDDPAVASGAPGNTGIDPANPLPAFEIAEGTSKPAPGSMPGVTLVQTGANATQLPWGGTKDDPAAERAQLAPLLNQTLLNTGLSDPVDVTLRTFRAYYPLNYPGSTNNFDFTFGTSIEPDIGRFRTGNPFGRGHSSGCSGCHAPYAYDGSRQPTPVVQDDGKVVAVVDPTTQHREFHADQDIGMLNGQQRLLGRAVTAQQQSDDGRAQQKTYSRDHQMTTRIDTDTCGLCHGFVTRINLAYQGFAEEEQRDQLARRKEIDFVTPSGTKVRIFDSWLREDNSSGSPVIQDISKAQAIITAAKQRDADLAAQGFIPGNGGCAQATFTEDCNNDGELETSLVLTRVDDNGVKHSVTINEDLDRDTALGLIDRVPREKSVDGRQMRYVYGGRNGSTRQMDIHFQNGMHCIDCHFLQDAHGDGHVYSTNWDTIEIECEDCHGAKNRSTLLTSGPNGGNNLRLGVDDNKQPFFQDVNGQIVQHSRVTPGLSWVVPQTADVTSPLAKQAHDDNHMAEPGAGSTFAGQQGQSPLMAAKVECQTCHSSWVHNCMGCHLDLNFGDPQRKLVQADGSIIKSPHENETWLSNANNTGHVNFQLLGLMRSPFVLGTGSIAEKGRLAPFRSSMQLHVTITGPDGNELTDNQTFTTFQTLDANSARMNVATSAVAMNQTMPHTTRPNEARSCAACHSLVNAQGQIRNEHWMAETFGLGTGAYPYAGDWGIAAGGNGLELFEYKAEQELAANVKMKSQRFPGMVVSPNTRTIANVEPKFDTPGAAGVGAGGIAVDVALIRNFNATPALGGTIPPTLRDLAVMAVNDGGAGKLVLSDITHRGVPGQTRPSVADPASTFVLALPAAPVALAHLAPDVSDPFVYIADGTAGVVVVQLLDAPGTGVMAARIAGQLALGGGKAATDVALAGDILYVGTSQGTVETLSIAVPGTPALLSPPSSTTVDAGNSINDMAVSGFMLYVATARGVAPVSLDDPDHPGPVPGTSAISFTSVGAGGANGISVSAGHVYAAAGTNGVFDIDMRTPAAPAAPVNLTTNFAPGAVNAVDVIVSKMPSQTWLLALDAGGDFLGIKLDNRVSIRERCYAQAGGPDPSCLLDMDFLDPTITQRDPSFDPNNGSFDAGDPSGVPFFRQASQILGTGRRLARPAIWEQINTLTGRRVRDSFMPGSGTLSLGVMQMMRSVKMCESTTPSNTADGLNQLGYAMGAGCTPIGDRRRPASVCRVLPTGRAECQPRTTSAQLVDPSTPSTQTLRAQISPVFRAPR